MNQKSNLLFQIWEFKIITVKYRKTENSLYNALTFETLFCNSWKNVTPSEYKKKELPTARYLH